MIGDHALYAFGLALASIVGIVVCVLTGHGVPTSLPEIAIGMSIGGSALAKRSVTVVPSEPVQESAQADG